MIELNSALDRLLQAKVARDWARTDMNSVCPENTCGKELHLEAVEGGKPIPVGRHRCDVSDAASYNKILCTSTLPDGTDSFLQQSMR